MLPASGEARRRYARSRSGAWREDWRLVTSRLDIVCLAGLALMMPPNAMATAWLYAAWLATTVLCFVVIVPGTYGGRYLVPALAPLAVLAATGADRLLGVPPTAWTWMCAVALLAWVPARWRATAWGDIGRIQAGAQRAATLEQAFRRRVATDLAAVLPPGAILGLIEVDLLWLVGRDDLQVVSLDGVLDRTMLKALARGAFVPALAERGATHVLIESCLYARPGWTAVDLAPLATADRPMLLPGGGRATPLASWPYRNWGDRSTDWPWRLWRLDWPSPEEAACSR
jgi:hypothetical protein